jgi:uncharacterized protein YjiS (DUF1127 family)
MSVLRFDVTPAEPTAPAGWSPYEPTGEAGRRGEEQPSLRATIRGLWRRHRSRVELVRMNAHMLKDIGISAAEAEYEANKPFWRG